MTAAKRYASFREFYPFYLSEHTNPTCRRLHFVGTTIGVACLLTAIATRDVSWLVAGLFGGYFFAWIGHIAFEKNRPATFTYPVYSFLGDWMMWRDILTRRMKF